ncbi:MAG: hypothetical protein CMJ64_03405 [Planctomycetaceae bacterium]|nr:hypothetical protein [Planctomycetaceae bacterium]
MNAIPKREGENKARNSSSTNLLVDALVQSAATLADDEPRRLRLDQLRSSATGDLRFTWQTHDGREADFRIYYDRSQDGDISGTELVQLDFREPTIPEQAQYEAEFESELDSGGDLWSRVASRIRERVD